MKTDTVTKHSETHARCCKSVSSGERWASFHQCTRKAVVERDGKHYCKIHDPEQVKARDVAQRLKWKQESEEHERAHRLRSAAPALLAACEAIVEAFPGLQLDDAIGDHTADELRSAIALAKKGAV